LNCAKVSSVKRSSGGTTEIVFNDNSSISVTQADTYIIEAINNTLNRLDKTARFDFFEDFLTGSVHKLIAYNTGSGSGISAIATSNERNVGVVNFATGTTASGRYGLGTSVNVLMLGSGLSVYETYISIPTLSTSLERYQVLAGFVNAGTSINQTNGVYVLYDEGGVSTGSTARTTFQLVTVNASARTFVDSGIVVNINTWYKIRVFVFGGIAYLYINNIFACSTTLTINTSTTLMFGNFIYKSVGVTSSILSTDYIHTYKIYSSET
jgi:hypothetical protein